MTGDALQTEVNWNSRIANFYKTNLSPVNGEI